MNVSTYARSNEICLSCHSFFFVLPPTPLLHLIDWWIVLFFSCRRQLDHSDFVDISNRRSIAAEQQENPIIIVMGGRWTQKFWHFNIHWCREVSENRRTFGLWLISANRRGEDSVSTAIIHFSQRTSEQQKTSNGRADATVNLQIMWN